MNHKSLPLRCGRLYHVCEEAENMLHVITWEEARELLTARLVPLEGAQWLELQQAADRVLATDIRALEDIPPGDRSMVDGYALRAADTNGASETVPALLTCVGEAAMGQLPTMTLEPGQCCRIWTGGFLPRGADAAVMVEDTELLADGTVCVSRPAAPGSQLVFRGDEMSAGELLLERGEVLSPAGLGTLAAMGLDRVPVFRQPLVGLLSTGDELVEAGETPGPGQMRDVNRPVLRACVEQAGGRVLDLGILPDRLRELEDCLAQAADQCDFLVMTGGTSAGERDYAPELLGRLGTVLWHGLAVKPGKPTLGAVIGRTPVLGLPGHPAAACMLWQLLGLPVMDALLGRKSRERLNRAVLTEPVSANDGRARLLPVRLEGDRAVPIRSKSGIISQLLLADGFVIIGRDREGAAAGETVDVHSFYGKRR